jgi:hypothetical protein
MSDYKIDTLEVETQIIAPEATTSVAGLQSPTDKTKLDSVQSGATANATDAALRDRATHTGTQLSTTISDFSTAASTAAPVQSVAGQTGTVVLSKSDVGLNLVDNTSDLSKPISTATQTALNNKYDASNPTGYQTSAQVTSTVSSAITTHESALNPHPVYETSAEAQAKVDAHANLTTNPHSVTKAQVGLGSVDNTSDLAKPISTLTQTALDLKYDATNPSGYQTAAQVTSTVSAASTTDRDRANHTGTQTASTISDFSEAVDDRVAALVIGGTGITSTYNDVANTLTIATTITQYTDEQAQDAVGTILTDSSSVDFTYNDVANTITAAVLPAGVNHNALQNYVANQHVDHSTVSITAGTGLSGGGDLTTTRTLNIANTTVTAGSYGNATNVPTFTVNAQGQITASSNTAITFPVTSVFSRSGIVTAQSGDYNATQITNTPAGNIASTTVQAALDELDAEKAKLAGGNTFTGDQFMGGTFVNITPAPLNMVASAAGTALTQLNLVNTGGGGGAGSAIDFHTYDVAGGTTPGARITAIDDNFSAYLAFITKIPGAATNGVLERMRITNSGEVSIGTSTPNASAKVQIDSTTQGFLMPRMTSAQRLAIVSPASGLMVYDTDLGCRCVYSSAYWTFEYDINTTAIQSSTSTTYANITELVTASLEPGLYAIRLRGVMQSTALTTGVGLRLVGSTATVSELVINWKFGQAGNGTDKNYEYAQILASDNVVSSGVLTANANFPAIGDGVFRITVGGNIAIQLRSETNGVSMSIRPNSTLIIRKVG